MMKISKGQEEHDLELHKKAIVVDHIDQIVKVAGGVDNVGLRSDFDGVPTMAQGLEDVSKLPNLTRALVARGYSDQDVEKILGGNFLRVIKNVWK